MAPKEKAKELFDKMYRLYNRAWFDVAKQCSLLAADEIIANIEPSVSGDIISARIIYWQKVKEEIEKL